MKERERASVSNIGYIRAISLCVREREGERVCVLASVS